MANCWSKLGEIKLNRRKNATTGHLEAFGRYYANIGVRNVQASLCDPNRIILSVATYSKHSLNSSIHWKLIRTDAEGHSVRTKSKVSNSAKLKQIIQILERGNGSPE